MVPGILYLIDLDQRDVKACYKCLQCYFSHSTVLVLGMVLVILVYGFKMVWKNSTSVYLISQ